MTVLKMKSESNDNLSNQMALMQLRWQQMRQFEFQSLEPQRADRVRRDQAEKLYSVA